MLRAAYRHHLDAFNRDVLELCDLTVGVMAHASTALVELSLDDAETALTQSDALADLRLKCEDRGLRLLALQNPVASDLRLVLTSIHIVEDLHRMGALARNIALLARQRHPHRVYPEELEGYVAEMARMVRDMGDISRDLLEAPDPDTAVELHTLDEEVDEIKAYLSTLLTDRQWDHPVRQAVDLALLTRYYERYADRCVSVGRQIVFQVTGLRPEDYVRSREEPDFDPQARFAEIERRYRAPSREARGKADR